MAEQCRVEEKVDVSEDCGQLVPQVIAEVLETMFFEEAVPATCEHEWFQTAVSARLEFSGSHSGELRLCVSASAVPSIAAGFLGVDPEDLAPGQAGQVILELTNILCGAVMSRLWPESSLALDPPALGTWLDGSADFAHHCFQLPDGPIAVSMRMRSGA